MPFAALALTKLNYNACRFGRIARKDSIRGYVAISSFVLTAVGIALAVAGGKYATV